MLDGFGIQWTLYQGPTMVNVRVGDDDEEVMTDDARMKLRVVAGLAAESAATAGLLKATAVAEGLLGATPVSSVATAPAAAPGGPSKACEHGQMSFTTGVSKKSGKPWKAWDCPAGSPPNGCGRQFINDRA